MTPVEATGVSAPPGSHLPTSEVSSRENAAISAPSGRGNSGFELGDFIDLINPLQHIPGVAEVYRSITNDQISDQIRKSGNAIYGFALGGPIGLGAMMAYNALGDHYYGSSGDKTQSETVLAASEGPSASDGAGKIPVPEPKPGTHGFETRDESMSEKSVGTTTVLGETIASAGTRSAPLVLHEILTGTGSQDREGPPSRVSSISEDARQRSSSISYVDETLQSEASAMSIPDDEDLSRLAGHKSNHLPLDVLKALQERHAERTASKRT
ncbi:hypothetical protein [Roseibium sp. SCP14]|uniref:hypothetical protein n=1 Tax=Roseibium sp. SCP14 TaxID=3141375 RepID=UPI0033385148